MSHYIAVEPAPRDLLTLPRTAATVDAAFVIRGGGIPFDQSLQSSWVVEPVTVDGRRFVEICAQDARCKLYFEQNFAMVRYIKQVRDRKVFELMLSVLPQTDPNEDNPVVTSVSDRARPNQSRPAQTGPDEERQNEPDQAKPSQAKQDQTRIDANRPDQSRAEQIRPDQTMPDG